MGTPSGATGPAIGDVILAKWNDRGRVNVRTSSLRVAWAVNAAGDLSTFVRLADALAVSRDLAALRGWWLFWSHPTLGDWGGPVQDVAETADGIVELAASGWLALLDKRLTRRRNRAVLAQAGPIAGRLLRDANAVTPTGIGSVDAEEAGAFVAWQDDGGDLRESLGRLADLAGQEYLVDPTTRILRWRAELGTDRRTTVQLVQGRHIAAWRPAWSLEPVVTEIVLEPSDPDRFATAPAVSGTAAAAYAAFGPRQERGTYRGRLPRAAVRAAAQAQAAQRAKRGQLLELDVVDADGCFAWFRVGDTITALLPDVDRAFVVRTLAQSWDQETDILRVSAEIVG